MITTIIGALIAIVAIAALSYYYYYGVLTPVKVHNEKAYLGPRKYLYFNKKMNYCVCGGTWGQVAQEMYKHFQLSVLAGIFYDPYELVEDLDNCRITFGILVNQTEEMKIESFMKEYPHYELTTLPKVDAVWAEYPYRGMKSFYYAVKKVYPKTTKFLENANIPFKSVMEIYDCSITKKIQFIFFHGEKSDQYVLTKDEPPKYKSKKSD